MGQLLAQLAKSCQCHGAQCHSECLDGCCGFDFERDAEEGVDETLDLPFVHWERHV